MKVLVAQPCSILCTPIDCSPPGFFVHGILQARMLEWVAMPFSRVPSQLRDQTRVSYVSCIGRWGLYHLCHPGSTAKQNQATNKKDEATLVQGVSDSDHIETRVTYTLNPGDSKPLYKTRTLVNASVSHKENWTLSPQ